MCLLLFTFSLRDLRDYTNAHSYIYRMPHPPPMPARAAGGTMPGYIGEGFCATANGERLPYYGRPDNPKNDQGAYCSGQCAEVAGCAGFTYSPSYGYCELYGAAFTLPGYDKIYGAPSGRGRFNSGGGTGPITKVNQDKGWHCYARAGATATTTQPGKVAA